MALHIFWDNSNILGAVQIIQEELEPEISPLSLRVHFKNLFDLVFKGRQVVTKVMVGSVPPECNELWAYAKKLGFNTDLMIRIDDAGVKHEQAVDELLHLKIANAIIDYDPPQTLVVLSGDSNVSTWGTSFPDQIKRALKKGWEVEVYSARKSISKKIYDEICNLYPGKISIIYLDDYYKKITFVKEGEYYRKDSLGNKIFFEVKQRNVEKL